MRAAELDYELPPELIAQNPLPERDGARLLCVDPLGAEVTHGVVQELPRRVAPALWVVNDTRVIPARLLGQKESGGRVELLLVERLGGDDQCARWLAMAKGAKGLRPDMHLALGAHGKLAVRVVGRQEEGLVELELQAPSVTQAIEEVGQLPLPPYIERAPEEADRERYQTVYADKPGAVAAPTAGLHLSEALMGALREAGHRFAQVTLHVGPGTFAPLRHEDLAEHPMHREHYDIPESTAQAIAAARAEGRPVLAVGTTVVRTLEAAATGAGLVQAGPGSTALCIYPPYRFKVVDQLLTNFHLPRSTLLALVMAFGGTECIRAAYRAAVAERYRFFSYGDAMWIRSRV